ncbi:three prime repair exonuclease 1 [Elysia marginata]|uniref:Three prime repair exonuclease 1 n=1 Tax=Elysia marginata TaxID=1093978 RepID=A0AAV4IL04_9GAST|nr:three prime repair exonuclease 1 [Elysia marginata]
MATPSRSSDDETVVFFAVGSTGWMTKKDPKDTKITSICFLPTTKRQLKNKDAQSWVVNKLALYFNPEKRIHERASMASGLYNADLKDCPTFDQQAGVIVDFLKNLPKPIRLLAHSGDNFHFRLLFLHLEGKIPSSELEGIFCSDTLKIVKKLDPDLKSKKLDDWHKSVGGNPTGLHGPEDKCQKLWDIVRTFDADQLEKFFTLCEETQCTFRNVGLPVDYSDSDNDVVGGLANLQINSNN